MDDIIPMDPRTMEDMECQFKEELLDCLDDCDYYGSFSSLQSHQTYANPGLALKGFGTVGLPLGMRDAEAIASICKRSPFGKGDQTLVDTSVRRTWELDASEFECRNPIWPGFLAHLVQKTLEELGVRLESHAQAYKLLLYEEGAFFKPHKDTEKVPGMFGTLVICLPSPHTGGEVHLQHNGQERTLTTAPGSAHNLTTLGWYSDVTHEVKPVESGFRLALTYNLVQDQTTPRQSAVALDETKARLDQSLRLWSETLPDLPFLLYPLSYQYTFASLSLSALKGQDAAKGQLIDQSACHNGMFWFLGQLTRQKTFQTWNESAEVEYMIENIVTPNGLSLDWRLFEVDETCLLPAAEELYERRRPDSVDEEEYTGNASTPASKRYHNSVLILMRKEEAVSQFLEQSYVGTNAMLAFFELLHNDFKMVEDESSMQLMIHASKGMMDKVTQKINGHNRFLMKWENRTLAHQSQLQDECSTIFLSAGEFCYRNGYNDIIQDALKETMKAWKWFSSSSMISIVKAAVQREALTRGVSPVSVWCQWLAIPPPPNPTFEYIYDVHQTLEEVQKSLLPQDQPAFTVWATVYLTEQVGSIKLYSNRHIGELLQVMLKIPVKVYQESILPNLLLYLDRLQAFYLFKQLDTWPGLEHVVKITYGAILNKDPAIVTLLLEDFQDNTQKGRGLQKLASQQLNAQKEILVRHFLDVLGYALALGLDDDARALLVRGLPELPAPGSGQWSTWNRLIDLNENLLGRVEAYDAKLHEALRPYIVSTLRGTTEWLMAQRPVRPKDWKQTGHELKPECDPKWCTLLHQFLISPSHSVCKFKCNQYTREHIRRSLGERYYVFDREKNQPGPYTLIVNKTSNEFQQLNGVWESNIRLLQMHLHALRFGPAGKTVFGDEIGKFDDTDRMLLATGVHPLQPVGPRPLGNASALTQNLEPRGVLDEHVAKKRRTEVIDLT
ncbi:hypothetical protein P171DRAFT_416500 [Karstenula rhodostoma CBS 690.94]|uniref:Prolyl 4-hydroxylase alpha subunit Fe(2+) 2OG dioxygenase domain-containing protein n=1 Tax=Karstenula rhodostoma CBS 690.94 TaxID=1392251 RepID=A0A9P4PFC1_9PLEO|nr:hypothetical protein P171DRAFT_416500 [Karstenula rhodostoma CBS 690.94]